MQYMHGRPVSRISTQRPGASLDSNDHLLPLFTILFLYPNPPHHPLGQPTHITCHYHRSLIQHTQTQKNTLSARTSHLPTHINTKHIIRQDISLTNSHKHKTYCPSEHLTQQNTHTQNTLSVRTSHSLSHTNITHIVHQNLPLVVDISTYHMWPIRNIICYEI